MSDCSLCTLIKEGKNIIFENDKIIAVLHPKPSIMGHILIMPKEHYPIIEQVPDFVIAEIFNIANKISTGVFEGLNAQGSNILINNGVAAGQKSAHFAVNILPRAENDGLNLEWAPKQLSEEEMSTVELQIKEETGKVGEFEKEKEKPIDMDKDTEEISEKGDEENYLIKQLDRIP